MCVFRCVCVLHVCDMTMPGSNNRDQAGRRVRPGRGRRRRRGHRRAASRCTWRGRGSCGRGSTRGRCCAASARVAATAGKCWLALATVAASRAWYRLDQTLDSRFMFFIYIFHSCVCVHPRYTTHSVKAEREKERARKERAERVPATVLAQLERDTPQRGYV
jgi:hypothetical protein